MANWIPSGWFDFDQPWIPWFESYLGPGETPGEMAAPEIDPTGAIAATPIPPRDLLKDLGIDTDSASGLGLNWWTPWLKGEAIVAGGLIAGPTVIDLLAAMFEGGKNGKKNAKMSAGMRHAADGMRESSRQAMPAIASLLMNPAVALPFIYINLEALHKQGLIDSAIAHTIEPVMISAVMIEAIGKALGPLAAGLMKA